MRVATPWIVFNMYIVIFICSAVLDEQSKDSEPWSEYQVIDYYAVGV